MLESSIRGTSPKYLKLNDAKNPLGYSADKIPDATFLSDPGTLLFSRSSSLNFAFE